MKETRIYIIRHGSVENPEDISYGRLPVPLSEKGRKEVKDFAQRLLDLSVKFNKVYSSPAKRAMETAEIICKRLGIVNFETRDDLNETDIGELEGAPMQILRDADYKEDRLAEMGYKIESKKEVVDRVSKLISEILTEHEGEVVAFVSHGDPTRLAIWSQDNPERTPPNVLRDKDYLATAEAAILRFKGENYVGKEFVRREVNAGPESGHIKRTEAY